MNKQFLLLASLGALLAYLTSPSGKNAVSIVATNIFDTFDDLKRGERLNNPGNIEKGQSWQGQAATQPDSRFIAFDSPEWGFRAMTKILRTYANAYGLHTIASIISRWAPSSDNNPTQNYIATVAQRIGVNSQTPINVNDPSVMFALVKEIARFEQGRMIYDDETITRGIEMGFA